MPAESLRIKPQTQVLSKELSEPLPDPGEFEGVKRVGRVVGDLGDQYVTSLHSHFSLKHK